MGSRRLPCPEPPLECCLLSLIHGKNTGNRSEMGAARRRLAADSAARRQLFRPNSLLGGTGNFLTPRARRKIGSGNSSGRQKDVASHRRLQLWSRKELPTSEMHLYGMHLYFSPEGTVWTQNRKFAVWVATQKI